MAFRVGGASGQSDLGDSDPKMVTRICYESLNHGPTIRRYLDLVVDGIGQAIYSSILDSLEFEKVVGSEDLQRQNKPCRREVQIKILT